MTDTNKKDAAKQARLSYDQRTGTQARTMRFYAEDFRWIDKYTKENDLTNAELFSYMKAAFLNQYKRK